MLIYSFRFSREMVLFYILKISYLNNFQNMSTYKLTYFNVTGLAESIRYILNHCGIKFEDIRLSFDDWPKYKSSMSHMLLFCEMVISHIFHLNLNLTFKY